MTARQSDNAIAFLKADHRKINDLFKTYAITQDRAMKQRLAQDIFVALDIHTQLEDELFHPAFAEAADTPGKILVDNARQDHRMIADVIAALQALHDAEFDAKFSELMEDVQNHVLEEEAEMFPQAEALLHADMGDMCTGMQAMKRQLMTGEQQACSAGAHGAQCAIISSCYERGKRRTPVELDIIFLGGLVLILSHYCAYKVGKSQGWMDTYRKDTRYRYGKEGMVLRAGETFFGVVDARKGPYFFVTNVGRDVDAE
jgi:hemerythrin superfamily protein